MQHYGDICKLSGYELPMVDLIVGGSPCQDLSIAGARKGMTGACDYVNSDHGFENLDTVEDMSHYLQEIGKI